MLPGLRYDNAITKRKWYLSLNLTHTYYVQPNTLKMQPLNHELRQALRERPALLAVRQKLIYIALLETELADQAPTSTRSDRDVVGVETLV